MLAKAAMLAADEVLIDLEDALAPGEKTDETRERVVRAIVDQRWVAGTIAVRVNAVSTRWCYRDVAYVAEGAGARLDCVIVPKVEAPSHVQFVHHLLDQLEAAHKIDRRIGIEALVENARGLVNVAEIASASDRLEALIFGPGDYAASVGVPQLSVGELDARYPGDQWHYALSRVVSTARAFGLQAVDGPFAAIRDIDGYMESARRSALLGFDGKWVIHPNQIAPANDVFTPSQAQYESAVRLLEAYARATEVDATGAALHNGEMIDEASRKLAESVVARARAAGLSTEAT